MQTNFLFSSLNTQMNNMKLKMKWELKKANGFNDVDPFKRTLLQQAESVRKNAPIEAISNKIKSGKKLSIAELEYIKKNAPQLYEQAVKAMKERESYREELRKCKTKDEVMALKTQKVAQYVSEVNSIEGNSVLSDGAKLAALSGILMRLNGAEAELGEFMSEEGANLKWQREIDNEEAKEKAAAIEQEEEELKEEERLEETDEIEQIPEETPTDEATSDEVASETDKPIEAPEATAAKNVKKPPVHHGKVDNRADNGVAKTEVRRAKAERSSTVAQIEAKDRTKPVRAIPRRINSAMQEIKSFTANGGNVSAAHNVGQFSKHV